MNRVIVLGKLSKAPNLEYVPAGPAVCTLTVETEEEFKNNKGEKKTRKEWIRVVSFGDLAESCQRELKAGSTIMAVGQLHHRKYGYNDQVRVITEVISKDVQFLDYIPKENNSSAPLNGEYYTTEDVKWGDGEIPF